MRRHTLTFVRVLAILGLALLPLAPTANAAPDDSPLLANSPTLNLRDLGVNPDLLFYGQVGAMQLTVPVLPA